ncbi:MAG: thioredoxin [Hyphomicrobiales bacterium]|nr:thioredoxin [Hyphomicrobiales bacterium]
MIEPTPAPTAPAPVKDATTASFREDVISESLRQPVLVDFWAPWCGPCKQLAPALERAVAAAQGKVKLVKMNIDEHPQIPGQLGIQSIPAVIAFQKGQPIDGFVGALPESQIVGFIERLVGPVESEADAIAAEADAAFAAGDLQAAAALHAEALELEPGHAGAIAGRAKALVAAGDLDGAAATLDAAPPEAVKDPGVAAARAALVVARQGASVGDERALEETLARDPKDRKARFDLALALNARGERAGAADHLLEIVRTDRAWDDDAARKQLLQFFEAWGPTDEATVAARRKLAGLLYR